MSKIIIGFVVLVLVWVAYHNTFLPEPTRSVERIIFVPGVNTKVEYLAPWKQYLAQHVPGAQVDFLEGYYTYQTSEEVVEMRDKLVELIRAGETDHIHFITHSYGGVLLASALEVLKQDEIDLSYQAVTLASPFAPDRVFDDEAFFASRRALGFYDAQPLPKHISLCGVLDTLVTCRRAVYPNQKPVRVVSSHTTFLLPQLFAGRTVLRSLFSSY